MSSPSIPTSAETAPSARKLWLVKAYVALVALVNLGILWLAWEDKSWGALGLAIATGPIANGVLLLIGLLATAFRKRMGWRTTLFNGLPMAFLPILAIGIDGMIIFNMGLSGC